MKNSFTSKLTVAVAVFGLLTGLVVAGTLKPLPISAQAAHGATELTFADLAESSSITAEVVTSLFAVPAKWGVAVTHVVLETAWDNGNGAQANTVALSIGDGGDPDRFLTATELAEDGTEVWLKYGTASETVYTAADTVDFTFTPTGPGALNSHTVGSVKVYFHIIDAR